MTSAGIDFAPRTARRSWYSIRLLTLLLSIIAVASGIAAAWSIREIARDADTAQATLQRLRSELRTRSAGSRTSAAIAISATQAAAVNAAIARLNLPWTEVFDAIEAATPSTIALLALDQNARAAGSRGTAEAKSADDMIAYVESLKKQAFFRRVALLRHEVNEQDTNRPLRFEFEASWAESAP